MDIENAKMLSYENIRNMYKSYLNSLELGRNTIQTVASDTFYLWNNSGQKEFWEVVTSDNFEEDGRALLKKALSANSGGNVEALVNGYLSNLRRFRNFIFSDEVEIPQQDDYKALKDFLLDIECLDPLAEWTSKFNLFDILRISRVEIRHSNMLAWLLNPNENHGLSDSVLRGFIQYVVTIFTEDEDIFDMLLMDSHDFLIYREWHHIDLLAVSSEEKFVLCIENKIDTGEHDNQLKRYRNIVEDTYPDYKRMYIYLSPEGLEASEPDYWCAMSYQDVLNIMDSIRKKTQLLPDAELLINNYMDTIRRDIVGDERLVHICKDIYTKHQKALDLIFENKPDRASDLAEIFRSWACKKMQDGELEVVLDKCNKTYTRFKTKTMSMLLPDAKEALSGWNTKNHYFYEINNNGGNEFYIQLSLSSKNISDELRDMCNKINVHYPSKQQKENWQWRTPFSTKHSKVDEEISEDKVFEQLNKKLDEIKAFETKLVGLLEEEQ